MASEIQEIQGRQDHREPDVDDADVRFATAHSVHVRQGGCLNAILGGDVRVNSLHRQAIDSLAPGLQTEATAEDGTIEAVSVMGAKNFAIGVQWHPEYWAKSDAPSRKLFEAFGDAVRTFAASKQE